MIPLQHQIPTGLNELSSPRSLIDLSSDIIVLILEHLTVDALSKLSRTCRAMYSLVMKSGWAAYLRLNPQPSFSVTCTESIWSPFVRVRYDTSVNWAWSSHKFIARPLSNIWQGKLLPVLAISRSRLVVAAGSSLYSYGFVPAQSAHDAPEVQFEAVYLLDRGNSLGRVDARHDITAIVFVPDGGRDHTLCAGFADGVVAKITLPSRLFPWEQGVHTAAPIIEHLYGCEDVIEALAISGNFTLSLSATGSACLQDMSSMTSSTLHLNARSWSTYLSIASSTPFAAFGTSSTTPLAVHAITESHIVPSPYAILGDSGTDTDNVTNAGASGVYGLCDPPPSLAGGPGQVVVSGWYDGVVRIHDLRSSRHSAGPGAGAAPVLSCGKMFSDPWSFEPIYTVSAGGGSGCYIAAGSARHSVVSFWDVRNYRKGWSVHAPGNDSSPVYSVLLESSRLFGASQSRAFVYDFGPGVTDTTYPPLSTSRRSDGLKRLPNGIGYYVTTYQHME